MNEFPYGYFLYRNNIFNTKESAFDQALLNKDYSPDIKFYFHEDTFSKIDWTIEPEQSLDELYRLRALQLRDQYDYLILQYSGGVDSNQILQTFLKHDIFLDEVRVNYPVKAAESIIIDGVPSRVHPLGLLFEYKLAALPRLAELAKKSPKTKIEVVDLTPDLGKRYDSDSMIDGIITSPVWYHRIRLLSQIEAIDATHTRKVGVIYGADKPNLTIINDQLMFYFLDIGRTGAGRVLPNDSQKTILFYWSNDFPLIPIKQSHVIKNALERSQKLYNAAKSNYSALLRENDVIKALIYPSFERHIYQKIKGDETADNNIIYRIFGQKSILAIAERSNHTGTKYNKISLPFMGSNKVVKSKLYNVGQIVTKHEI